MARPLLDDGHVRRRHLILVAAAGALALALAIPIPRDARAATGSETAASPMAGNGHNVSFDGRIFVVRRGNDDPSGGWFLMVLRPERVTYRAGGVPVLTEGAFSEPAQVQPFSSGENALALCEADADDTPYACDEAGDRAAGPYACYDFFVLDSNAYAGEHNGLRRRRLKVWIASPGTADARLHRHQWIGGVEPVRAGAVDLRGIEPTVSRDGRLLVWQGHPANDGQIDALMYATNDTPCGATGWDGPHNLSHMHADARARGRYRLSERQLRAADGTPFPDGTIVRGAYPWLFGGGEALIFTAAPMPCRATEDPPGCGPRRNALSVIGYPTNWGVAHIDGDVNPSTTDTVRLFFSSPGPGAFGALPVTGGADVWPFFGSNTSNYTELVFDDALDGSYAGVWHMNESVTAGGELDRTRTPDTSGYFNTGVVRGASFPDANNGLFGKALVFGGDGDHVEVPHDAALDPVNALTVEMWLRPSAPVDCDANNNYRFLLGKGNIGDGSYSLVIEEGETFQARVRAGGTVRAVRSARSVPVGAWSHVGFTYDATSGALRVYVNGELAGEAAGAPATLSGSTHPLRIGGPGGARATCPNGDGAFAGDIDEVRVSRSVRDLTLAPRPGNHARFVSQAVPVQAEAGRPFRASFTYRNVGTTAWSPATLHRLGSQAPMDTPRWGAGRVELPRRVQPGETVTIEATLTAPSELGFHDMQWGLVQDGAEWFGPHTDLLTVEVVPPGTLPDAGPPPVRDAGAGERDAGIGGAVDGGGTVIPPRDGGSTVSPMTDGGGDPPGGGVTGGCGCRVATPRSRAPLAWLAVIALALGRRRARKMRD